MNLRFALLVRMAVVGTLCWLAASAYLVAQAGLCEAQEILKIADQIRPIITWDVMRRIGSIDADARYPDLGGAASRFPIPYACAIAPKGERPRIGVVVPPGSIVTFHALLHGSCARSVLGTFPCHWT